MHPPVYQRSDCLSMKNPILLWLTRCQCGITGLVMQVINQSEVCQGVEFDVQSRAKDAVKMTNQRAQMIISCPKNVF
jgi:hypothetical protein